MNTEVENIVRTFRANVMQEILYFRSVSGEGAVSAFAVNVLRHRERVLAKLQDMRARCASEPLETAATAINDMADAVTARIEAAGRIEFIADGAL